MATQLVQDLITLKFVSQGAEKVTVDLNNLQKAIDQIGMEAKDAKSGIRGLKDENKNLAQEIKEDEASLKRYRAELKQLRESGRGASDSAKQLSATIQKLNQHINDNTTRINSNNSAITRLENTEEAWIRTMKIGDMTMNQLGRRAGYLRAQLANTSKSLNPAQWKAYNDELVQVEAQQKKVAAGGEQVKSRFDGIGNTIKKVIPLMVAYKALQIFQNMIAGAKEFVIQSIEVARKAEGISNAFRDLGRPDLLNRLREQTKGLASDFTLMQAAVKADKFRIPINDLGNLLEFARRRAVALGRDVDDFQQRIIDGIGRQSKLRLDDLGLSFAEVSEATKKYHGFAQGIIGLVNKELEKQGETALTSADKAQLAAVKMQNAQLKLGNQLLWVSDIWTGIKSSVADGVSTFSDRYLPRIITGIQNVINLFITLYNTMPTLRLGFSALSTVATTLFDVIVDGVKNTIDAFNSLVKIGSLLAKGDMSAVSKEWDAVSERIASRSQKTRDKITNDWKNAMSNALNSKIDPVDFSRQSQGGNVIISDDDDPAGKEEKESKIRSQQKKEYDLLIESLETKHQERLAEIKRKYISGEIGTEAEYNQRVFAENQAYYMIQQEALTAHLDKLRKAKVKNTSLESDIVKKQAELNRQRLDDQIKFQSAIEKILLNADPLAKEEKEYKERLAALGIFTTDRQVLLMKQIDAQSEEEKQKIQKQLDALEILEKEHQDNVYNIRKEARKKADKKVEDDYKSQREQLKKQLKMLEEESDLLKSMTGDNSSVGTVGSALFGVESDPDQKSIDKQMELHRTDLQIIQEKIDARRKAGEDYKDLLTDQQTIEEQMQSIERSRIMQMALLYNDLGKQIGSTFGEILTGQKSLLEGLGGLLTDFVFDTLTAVVNAKVSEMTAVAVAAQAKMAAEAFATPDSVLSFGASGAARIAIIGGLITGALAAGKAALSSLLSGGKSSSGSSSSSTTSYKRVVSPGAESGGYINVTRAQDGKPFTAAYDPSRRGFVDRPTVLVGENGREWVLSNPGVENPTIAPVISLIDEAQRNGTVQSLDLNRAIRANMAGYASGGFTNTPSRTNSDIRTSTPAMQDYTVLNDSLSRLNKVLAVLEKTGVSLNYRNFEITRDKIDQIKKMSSR